MKERRHDAIIVGGGHNGLTCAAYLARAGWSVAVLERRPLVGGACVTEEPWPGYRVSTAAYVVSLFNRAIERDLQLENYGYRVLRRAPSSFTPLPDDRGLLLGPDPRFNREQIARFSRRDAERFPEYEALLARVAERLEPALEVPPPDLFPGVTTVRRKSLGKRLADGRRALGLWRALQPLGPDFGEVSELLLGSARTILDRWFESDILKATLATDAIIGSFQSISAPGSAYVLLHHVMGTAGGSRGVWGYVQGGMGALSRALAGAAEDAGAAIHCDTLVEEILVDERGVRGVRSDDGTIWTAPVVASNADPHVTFRRLLPDSALPDTFLRAVDRIDYSSASLKINLALAELPRFHGWPEGDTTPLRGTIHIGPSLDDIEAAYADALLGRPSQHPIIELTIPSTVDPDLAPPGRHVASMFVQYAPYALRDASWDAVREDFADRCIAEVTRLAPNFADAVLHRQVLAPVDLERLFGLTGGNIFHGAMSLHQLFHLRPVPGWSDHRTPIAGLYLCGAGAHPGGGVMGTPGRNAAYAIIADGRR
ncbi:MAG: NAD(P)/FAD-dependent oxidoreductase [Planctomycetota bacterium]|nr:MAG: NAD(P)/FAD-dependent oxidoreductase [Planctomycetota bacterium]